MKELEMLPLFDRFIRDTRSGRRVKGDGKRIKPQTAGNYTFVYRNLQDFSISRQFPLRIVEVKGSNKKLLQTERNYWKKFYRGYTDFLYRDRSCYDNYVGNNIKILKTFFRYLIKERNMAVGDFYQSFHVPEEQVPIVTLSPEQLRYLIRDTVFTEALPPHLQVSKDIFVFGCTVALRVSDIFCISSKNIVTVGDKHYLAVKTQKTGTEMRVKLPDYAYEILRKYHNKGKYIFPSLSLSQFNKNIKKIAEAAGWTYTVGKVRERQGLNQAIYLDSKSKSEYRFCDLVTSHAMRRTAITTMLIYGMPEHLVKLISGHAGNSKAFYRYVNYVQSFADEELDRVHSQFMV